MEASPCSGWQVNPLLVVRRSGNNLTVADILYYGAGHTGDLSSKHVHQTPCHFRLNATTICILIIFQEGVYIFIIFPRAHEYIQIVLHAGLLQLPGGLWWSFIVTSSLSVVFLICPLFTSGVLCMLSLFYLTAKLQSWFLLVLGLNSRSYHSLVLAKFANLQGQLATSTQLLC